MKKESKHFICITEEYDHPYLKRVFGSDLYRPGLMDWLPNVIEGKQKGFDLYIFKQFGDILNETYGFPIYQEQIIQLVSRITGMSLGEAGSVRRLMGKKQADVPTTEKMRFEKEAVKRDMSKFQANRIFEVLISFAGCAFMKAHAVAYTEIAFGEEYEESMDAVRETESEKEE